MGMGVYEVCIVDQFTGVCNKGFPDSKVHGANMGPSGDDRTQMGPMLAPWTLLSGLIHVKSYISLYIKPEKPLTYELVNMGALKRSQILKGDPWNSTHKISYPYIEIYDFYTVLKLSNLRKQVCRLHMACLGHDEIIKQRRVVDNVEDKEIPDFKLIAGSKACNTGGNYWSYKYSTHSFNYVTETPLKTGYP